MARPKKEIDKVQFEKLCALQCTEEEIAAWFDMSADTLDRECKDKYGAGFSECFKTYARKGRISLRRAQFKLAETNPSMAIFLGKQYLGQSEKASVEVSEDLTEYDKELKGWKE